MKSLFIASGAFAPRLLCSALLVTLLAGCTEAKSYPLQETPDTGGEGTVDKSDHNAFSMPQGNLPMTKRLDFSVGNSFFRNPWVIAPSSTDARDGLGTLFNTNSCQGCHIKDGRGHPPQTDEASISLFLRLAMPADSDRDADVLEQHGFAPHPVYGSQLQTAAIPGFKPEADLVINWTQREEQLADGTTVILRVPDYRIENPQYGPLPADLLISPRVAPPMIGLGLLQNIPEQHILAAADPDDADSDGISGRANRVWDKAAETSVLGRFGWKASEPTVMQQSMGAFAGDMGLTSTLVPVTDCTPSQGCEVAPHGGEPEVSDEIAGFIDFYASSLAVPTRRDMDDPEVIAGAQLFNQSDCAACHTPRHVTGEASSRPDLSTQTIWPYTDMLLHDMGPGLADRRDEFLADGNEWRTPPLWGIGLAQQINPRAGFLHDGRAETLEQAILWHGGEAQESADRYRAMSAEERSALIRFLESL
ncbi:di-heme oxidoredictase family protein [Halopseudomonas sp.]|uniref:di-heme oxidoreductase family protein n=1 Tax=Halopseudomonas sp. TaxID=2901191 RepID=UPI003568DCB0